MKSFTAVDLDKLARGQRVAGDVFRAIFSDPEAVADLARLLQARDLLTCPEPEPRPSAVPDMDVSFEELARHGEGRPLDPTRRAAVERFLGKHFPEAPAAAAESETYVDFLSQDTDFFPPKND